MWHDVSMSWDISNHTGQGFPHDNMIDSVPVMYPWQIWINSTIVKQQKTEQKVNTSWTCTLFFRRTTELVYNDAVKVTWRDNSGLWIYFQALIHGASHSFLISRRSRRAFGEILIAQCNTHWGGITLLDNEFSIRDWHGPLARYARLRVVHAPGLPGTFSPAPRVSDPDMHHGTCSLTSDFFEVGGGENVPYIPDACATRNITCLVRGPLPLGLFVWRHDDKLLYA